MLFGHKISNKSNTEKLNFDTLKKFEKSVYFLNNFCLFILFKYIFLIHFWKTPFT